MRRQFITVIILSLVSNLLFADDTSSAKWSYYMSYFDTRTVEKAGDKVFVIGQGYQVTGSKPEEKLKGSLFSYAKDDNSIKEYNKLNGLNDSEISYVKYNSKTKSLLIIYNNWNIDIIDNNTNAITNLPYLYENTTFSNKDVNSITLYNEYAYLATNFGIVVVNMEKKEIKDTYNLSLVTSSCIINDNKIYASTTNGILYAPLSTNLLDKNNWDKYPVSTSLFNANEVSSLFIFDNRMCFFVRNKGVYYEYNGVINPLLSNTTLLYTKLVDNKLACIGSSQFYIYSGINSFNQVNNITIKDISTADKADAYWIACGETGLKYISKNASGSFSTSGDPITLNSPQTSSSYKVVCTNSKVYVIPGGKAANGTRLGYRGYIMVYDYNKWETISPKNRVLRDFTSIAIDPKDPENIFVSSFGDGAAQFKKDNFIWYAIKNSTIESAISVPKDTIYKNIDGVGFDKYGNVWMNNSEANKPIKVMDTEGKWHNVSCSYLTNQYTLNNMLITSTDKKWFNIARINPKIVVLDNNGTIDDSDDTYAEYTNFTDQDGNNFSSSSYNCMAEDKSKQVWIGTGKGAIYITNPEKAASSVVRCTRVKLINDDGDAYYFLDNVKVNCITIDGGNRKWMGTEGSGVYVLSADNQEILHYFNTSNSPLVSDNIYSISINDDSGEVFIGTDKGLVSYKGEATKGKDDYSDVYAYPNPVRPNFNDKVTITGLMDDSNIKITDINGNLLYQAKSIGGQATWNCKNKSGNRVSTGIYLVLLSTNGGSESVVTKIAVIK